MSGNSDFLLQFGNIDFFKRMLAEGFTRVAYGSSKRYEGSFRIAAIFAFYKPDGVPHWGHFFKIPTWQVTKERALGGGEADYAVPCETCYSEAGLAEFLRVRGMVLHAAVDVAEALSYMEKQELDEELAAVS